MTTNMTTSTAYGPRVNILKKIKVGESWRFAPLRQDAPNRISWNVVSMNGLDEIHKEGSFYIEWYENGQPKRESVGKHPHEVLERARRKKLVLASERAGIEVKDHEATDSRRLHAAIAGASIWGVHSDRNAFLALMIFVNAISFSLVSGFFLASGFGRPKP